MYAITREFPFVEWGILFSEKRAGQPRYPDEDWLARFNRICAKANMAAHLCGGFYIKGFLDGSVKVSGFNRIQLNFNAGKMGKALQSLEQRIKQNGRVQVITQHNDANSDLWVRLQHLRNHAILFDQSGGHGVGPAEWEIPLPGVKCGYAGGLNPNNLARELSRIALVAGEKPTWIDIESGVRDEYDRLDLEKVRKCLAIASGYISNPDWDSVNQCPAGTAKAGNVSEIPNSSPNS
jgi:hypothetical protein